MNYLSRFLQGSYIPLKAMIFFTQNKAFWRYISIPVIINFFIYIVFFIFFWNYLLPLSDIFKITSEPGTWYAWALDGYNWLVGFTTVLTMLAISSFSFIYVLLIIEAPFLALLSERIEKELYGNEFDTAGWKNMARSLILGLKNSAILGAITLFWTAIFFVGNFILPGISTILGILVIGYYYGISFLVYSAELRMLPYAELRKLVRGNRMEVLGLGTICYLIILIPFIAVVFLPIAVVSGTMLYNEYIDKVIKE